VHFLESAIGRRFHPRDMIVEVTAGERRKRRRCEGTDR
jgi:hypothetical protein